MASMGKMMLSSMKSPLNATLFKINTTLRQLCRAESILLLVVSVAFQLGFFRAFVVLLFLSQGPSLRGDHLFTHRQNTEKKKKLFFFFS